MRTTRMTAALFPYYEKLGLLRRVDGVGELGRGHRARPRSALGK